MTNPIIVGKICGHFGVKGWLKIISYTRPCSNIFQYERWMIELDVGLGNQQSGQQRWVVADVSAKQDAKGGAKGGVVKLAGYDSRATSQVLVGCLIGIDRSWLEPLGEGDYYWLDLIGLSVINREGVMLGKIDHLIETGANDVLVVRSEAQDGTEQQESVERLLPWTADVVTRVDLENGVMTVDWKEDY